MVAQGQVGEELLVADDQWQLASVERESGPELQQEPLDVVDQRLLELALVGLVGKVEEVKGGELGVAVQVTDEHRIVGAGDEAAGGVTEPVQPHRSQSRLRARVLVATPDGA